MRDLVGNTPLVRLAGIDRDYRPNIFAKLEYFNPGGSVKDRIGISMIRDAEEKGLLHDGSTIIEATAGNTGIGIAFAALSSGYRVIFAVPDKFSIEKQILMKALGAEIVNTPEEEGMKGAIRKAEELMASIPEAVSLGQFVNPVNPETHYRTTGPEIYRDLDGRIDYLVAGAGSGGTFSGILRFLKEQDERIQGVLADPYGSIIGGGEHHSYRIEGIGNDFIAETMETGYIDKVVKIHDDEAFAMTGELAAREGIIAGTSSGAAVAAAVKLAREHSGEEINIVAVLPDRGDRYFSSGIYSQEAKGNAESETGSRKE